MYKDIEIGVDIIEVKRFRQKSFKKHGSFYKKNFTDLEINHCLKFSDPYPHFAGIFAAKEAIIKSKYELLEMKSIKIKWEENGKPVCKLNDGGKLKLSISHTKDIAIATSLYMK